MPRNRSKESDSSLLKTTAESPPQYMSFKEVLKTAFSLIPRTIGPIILIIFCWSVISAIICMLSMPSALWSAYTFRQVNASWLDLKLLDANYELTAEQNALYQNYSVASIAIRIIQDALGFLIPIGTMLLSASRLYNMVSHDPIAADSWRQSIKNPFDSSRKVLTAILLLIILIFFIPIGIMIAIIPGILLMVYELYAIYSFTIDEKEGFEVFRGGYFYAKENFGKICVLLLIGYYVPWGLSMLYNDALMGWLYPYELFLQWIDPATRNYGMLFLYYLTNYFAQYVLYFFFPVIYTVGFYDIQMRKITDQDHRKEQATVLTKDGIKTIEVKPGQQFYSCLVCGFKMPLGAKKCAQCGELYKIIIQRK